MSRLGIALRGARYQLSLGLVVVVLLTAFISVRPGRIGNGDCADAFLAPMINNTSETLDRAYDCFSPSFITLNGLTRRQLDSQVLPIASKLVRVGRYDDESGISIVDFVAILDGVPINYAIFLDKNGLVTGVE